MPKSLAELRTEKRADRRAERSMTVCLAHDLVAEVQTLTEELQTVLVQHASSSLDGDDNKRPRKMGEPSEPPRAQEIRNRLAELFDEMAEYEGELRVRANRTDGEWRRWVNEHPAREDKQPGHDRDLEVAAGFCNADDLLDDLATYAHTWNGEALAEGDWDALGVSPADQKQIAKLVVHMYELGVNLGKWRNDWSASLLNAPDSVSPETSESAHVASTAGSPRSDTSTTTPPAA